MAKQIRLTVPHAEVEMIATMLDKEAPATCQHVWEVLDDPITVLLDTDRSPEVDLFSPMSVGLGTPEENSIVCPAPGDLLLFQPSRELPSGDTAGSIGMFHQRRGRCRQPESWLAGNLFATVTQNPQGLTQVARDVVENGPQVIRIERVPACPVSFLRNGIIQVGQLVKDLDVAVEQYWSLFGIGPWKIYTYGKPLLRRLEYRGQPSNLRWRIAICWIGSLCLELMEVGEEESIYAEFVREHSYGLHHFAVEVEDMEAAIKQAEAAGISVLQHGGGQGLDGSGRFAYLDTEERIGAILEIVQFPRRRAPPEKVYPA